MVRLFPCPPMPPYWVSEETHEGRWTLLQRFEIVGSGAIAVSGIMGWSLPFGDQASAAGIQGRLACTRKDCGCVNETSCRTCVIDFLALSRYVHTEGS